MRVEMTNQDSLRLCVGSGGSVVGNRRMPQGKASRSAGVVWIGETKSGGREKNLRR